MRRTALQWRPGKDRTDDILQTLQPIGTHQADLPNASFLQLCEHLAPTQGAFRGLIEDPQHLAPLVFTHGKYHKKASVSTLRLRWIFMCTQSLKTIG